MDWSKLSSNEKLAVYGSVAAIIGGLVGGLSGLIWLSVLAAAGVLVVLFLPMMSANTAMPGSKGSLLVTLGGIAGVAAVLGLLTVIADIGYWFDNSPVRAIFFLIAVAGSLLVAWAGWQSFQGEGGKFNIGMAGGTSGAGAAGPPPPPATPPPSEPMGEPPAMGQPPSMGEPPSMGQPPRMDQPTQPREPTESDDDRTS